MDQLRPIEPLRILCLDGKEREFLLSMGGFKRVARKEAQLSPELSVLERGVESLLATLYEALLDKEGLDQDQLADLLPASEDIGDLVMKLTKRSTPDRPTVANSENPQEAMAAVQ